MGLRIQRKAALLRGKSMPPAKRASRRIDDGRREHRGGNAVNSGIAIVRYRRNVTETGRGENRGRRPNVRRRIGIHGPRAADCRGEHSNRLAKGPHRKAHADHRTPARARTGLCRGQRISEHQARANHDFRFHGIVVIPYIYAQELASRNTDCCRVSLPWMTFASKGCRQKPFDDEGVGFARIGCRSSGSADMPEADKNLLRRLTPRRSCWTNSRCLLRFRRRNLSARFSMRLGSTRGCFSIPAAPLVPAR